ncbi:hypothetical protein B0T14DRAFT_533991 [Immersiella caudata]|uniref:Uncharacterized protein n=1 Tax=Immersiella caudata TaxID=314043 RepID=A0AA39XH75_9PEZI|nr:hypothetical protein B0T14DRAFT_533991 [Immersiella caudata]
MMLPFEIDFVSPSAYNGLPHILDVADVPKVNAEDLDELRKLLSRHDVPTGVCIRLIHKHFNIVDNEIVVFEDIDVPEHGAIRCMHPIPAHILAPRFRGLNYFVNNDSRLQSYEYTATEAPDMSAHTAFLDEFCRFVVERGLQRKLGLKLGLGKETTSWTELELPNKRATIMIPAGIPIPDLEYDVKVTTEWGSEASNDYCLHGRCSHSGCAHCVSHDSARLDGPDLFLGGKKLEVGTPVHNIVLALNQVIGPGC